MMMKLNETKNANQFGESKIDRSNQPRFDRPTGNQTNLQAVSQRNQQLSTVMWRAGNTQSYVIAEESKKRNLPSQCNFVELKC